MTALTAPRLVRGLTCATCTPQCMAVYQLHAPDHMGGGCSMCSCDGFTPVETVTPLPVHSPLSSRKLEGAVARFLEAFRAVANKHTLSWHYAEVLSAAVEDILGHTPQPYNPQTQGGLMESSMHTTPERTLDYGDIKERLTTPDGAKELVQEALADADRMAGWVSQNAFTTSQEGRVEFERKHALQVADIAARIYQGACFMAFAEQLTGQQGGSGGRRF